MEQVEHFITKEASLLIVVNKTRVYEFRDITPRDMLFIHELKINIIDKERDYTETLEFLLEIIKRLLIFSNVEIEDEAWDVFLRINEIVQDQIFANRLTWDDFLGLVFACHNKSFSGLEYMMDLPSPIVMDMYDIVAKFYEAQAKMIKG